MTSRLTTQLKRALSVAPLFAWGVAACSPPNPDRPVAFQGRWAYEAPNANPGVVWFDTLRLNRDGTGRWHALQAVPADSQRLDQPIKRWWVRTDSTFRMALLCVAESDVGEGHCYRAEIRSSGDTTRLLLETLGLDGPDPFSSHEFHRD